MRPKPELGRRLFPIHRKHNSSLMTSFRRFILAELLAVVCLTQGTSISWAQGGHPAPPPPPPGAKVQTCRNRTIPQLEDVTLKSGIRFKHTAAPEKKYILESMSGGV